MRKRFVAWVPGPKDPDTGKFSKRPIGADGWPQPGWQKAVNLLTLEAAIARAEKFAQRGAGVGLAFHDAPIGTANGIAWYAAAVDLDHVVTGLERDESGKVTRYELLPYAQQIIEEMGAYTEISPSGRGLRILGLTTTPIANRKEKIVMDGGEISRETFGRSGFVTLTGWSVSGRLADVTGPTTRYADEWGGGQAEKTADRGAKPTSGRKVDNSALREMPTGMSERPEETEANIAGIMGLLEAVPANCGRDEWRDVIWSILNLQWQASEALARGWSERAADQYPDAEDALDRTINSFDPARADAPGIGTLVRIAKRHGWAGVLPWWPTEARRREQQAEAVRIGEQGFVEDVFLTADAITLDGALKRFVFLTDGSRVIDLAAPQHNMASQDFAAHYRASTVEEVGKKGAVRHIPVTSLWQAHPDRFSAFTKTFHPGKGVMCLDPQGKTAVNLWRPIARPVGDSAKAAPFVEHIEMLWGEGAPRFLDWLAHIEQQPGVLPQTGWLHIADHTGTGRNWVTSFLARLWAGHVAPNFDLVEMLNSGFNGRLSCKLLASVDEIKEGGHQRWQHSEKFKALLNAETREINPKYGRKSVEFNFVRWLVFSNSVLALPIGENDRRVEVVHFEGAPRSPAYYARIYGLLDDRDFLNGVAAWMRERDLSRFNPGAVAVRTAAKRRIVDANRSPMSREIDALITLWPVPWITNQQLVQILRDDALTDQLTPAMRLALIEKKCVQLDRRVKRPNGATRVWQLREHDRVATLDEVQAALNQLGGGRTHTNWADYFDTLKAH